MTQNIRERINNEMRIVPENCNCSIYTMAAVAGCLLLCAGIIIYALIGA